MQRFVIISVLCTLMVVLNIFVFAGESAATPSTLSNVAKYAVGLGDVLEISVWKNPDMSRQLPVLPDGTITLPLLGSFAVAGKDVETIGDELSTKMTEYVHEPLATVSVVQANSMVIYVIGKVNNPGRFPLTGSMDVLQALAMAGGLNPFAVSDEITIFRNTDQGRRAFTFDYEAASKGSPTTGNIHLLRGDTVVVR